MRINRQGVDPPKRWWDHDFSAKADGHDDDLLEELRELLDDSVRLRMRADVPVAVYISGGLDSSVIAALGRPYAESGLTLFGIGFEDERYDETE